MLSADTIAEVLISRSLPRGGEEDPPPVKAPALPERPVGWPCLPAVVPRDNGFSHVPSDRPHPRQLAGFRSFTATLPVAAFVELVTDREPLDGPRVHRFPRSHRRHHESRAAAHTSAAGGDSSQYVSSRRSYGSAGTAVGVRRPLLRGSKGARVQTRDDSCASQTA